MPRGGLLQSWVNHRFAQEPFDVYREKERKRTEEYVETALSQRVQERIARAAQSAMPWNGVQPRQEAQSGGGGWKSRLDRITPEFVEDTGRGVMKGLEVTDRYASSVPAALFTRGEVRDGQYTTRRNVIGNPIENVRSHVQAQRQTGQLDTRGGVLSDLKEAVQAQGRAGKAFQEDPDISPGTKIVAGAAFNPLSYVPAGGVAKAGRLVIPAALRGSKVGRAVAPLAARSGGLVESPWKATVGATAAMAAEAEVGDKIPGFNKLPDGVRQLAAGAVGGGLAMRGAKAPVLNLSEDEAKAAGRAWKPKLETAGDAEALGLDPAVAHSAEDVRKAYRARIREYHPDINASDTATEDAKAINAAFSRIAGGYTPAAGSGRATPPPPPGGGAAASGANVGGRGASSPPPPNGPVPPGAAATPPPAGPRVEDLFGTDPAWKRRNQERAFGQTVRGKVDAGVRRVAARSGGEKVDPNIRANATSKPFTVKERNRIANTINSYEGYADELWNEVENSGIKFSRDARGNLVHESGVPFGDIVELSTPAGRAEYAKMTAAQQRAIDDLLDFNEDLNANLRFHGEGKLPWDAAERLHFPRVVKSIDGQQRVFVEGGGKSAGAKKGFEKSRYEASMESGIANNIDYEDPRNAFRLMVRGKLSAASDDYMLSALKELGLTERQVARTGGKVGFSHVAVPTNIAPGLNGYYFEPKEAQRIAAALQDRSLGTIGRGIQNVNRELTPFRAVGDISWFGQQGAAMLFRHPIKGTKAAIDVIRSATGNQKLYSKLIEGETARGPGLKSHIEHGLHWVSRDLGEADAGFKPHNIPGYKQVAAFSNETFGRYMNYVRLVFANDAYKRIAKQGLAGDALKKEYRGAMNAVNRMSGFTGRNPTAIEKMGAFAPRYFSASVEQVTAALTKGGMEGSIARRHMARMLVIGGTIAVGINSLRGYETDMDPRSSNFLRIRNVGGLDVSPFGTYDTLFRAIAGTMAGEPGGGIKPGGVDKLWRLAEGKMSPAVKLVYEPFIRQSNYVGEPLERNPLDPDFAKTVYESAKSSLPFGIQNLADEAVEPAIKERDPKKLYEALPGTLASATGVTNTPMTPSERLKQARGEKERTSFAVKAPIGLPSSLPGVKDAGLAQERFGKGYDELTGREKSIVNEDPEVARLQDEADKNTLTRAGDRSENRRAQIKAQTQVEALTQRFEDGEITGSEFRDRYHDIQTELRGARSVLDQVKGDGELRGWFDLYDEAANADGSLDYDRLDALQADYRDAHPDIDSKVAKITGTQDNATMRLFRQAQAEAKEYYALPAYRGMTPEDSDRARRALDLANRLTSNGQAPTLKVALAALLRGGLIEREDMRLALIARKVGTSPERKAFLKEHPEFARFYRDAVTEATLPDVATVGTYQGARRRGKTQFLLPSPSTRRALPEIPQSLR